MVKNTKGGKKHKKNKNIADIFARTLLFKEEGQEYGRVIQLLGNSRVKLQCNDEKERLGIIRGAMKKKIWINMNDLLLIGLRDFENDKADIIHKYTNEEDIKLQELGHLSSYIVKDDINNINDIFITDSNQNINNDSDSNNENLNDISFEDSSDDNINDNINDKLDIDNI